MPYKNKSIQGIVEGKVTKPGKAVIQGKDVFPSAYAGPKKAHKRLPGEQTNRNV